MYNLSESAGLSLNLASAGVGIATGGLTFYTANATTYAVNGIINPAGTVAAIAIGTGITGTSAKTGWGTVPALSGAVPSSIGVGALPPALVADGVIRVIPNGYKATFGLWIDAAGYWHLTQGLPVGISEGNVNQAVADASMIGGPNAPVPAGDNNGWVLVALATVANAQAGGATFTFGTTSMSAAGVTTTIYNTLTLPGVALQ